MARKYTRGLRWQQNQNRRTANALFRRTDREMGRAMNKAMGCGVVLAILAVGTAAVFVGWPYI